MKKFVSMLLVVCMFIFISACGTSSPANSQNESTVSEPSVQPDASEKDLGKEIVINYPTYRVGSHVSAKSEKAFIDGFNEKYKGKMRVEVEELPGDDSYVEKMKILASSNALPDVVEGKDGILELAIRNGQAIDLTNYINNDPQYKKEIGEYAIKANTRDGKLYSISNANQLIGYFYNKEHFKKAGISPAKTWDEFMSNCEKLKEAGIIPISMMTGGNCWTTNLLLASMIGTANNTGNAFMSKQYPTEYATPEMKSSLKMIQKILKDYTTKDAIGGEYDIAANHFLQGNTAIICNGPWMTADFTNTDKAAEGLADKIGVALYPNNGVFAQYEIGYLVCADDKTKQDAAFEFIKYKTNAEAQLLMLEDNGTIPLTEEVKISDGYKKDNPLVAQLIELSASAKYRYRTFDQISYASVIEEMSKTYPLLAMGDITVDDMCKAMTEAATKNK